MCGSEYKLEQYLYHFEPRRKPTLFNPPTVSKKLLSFSLILQWCHMLWLSPLRSHQKLLPITASVWRYRSRESYLRSIFFLRASVTESSMYWTPAFWTEVLPETDEHHLMITILKCISFNWDQNSWIEALNTVLRLCFSDGMMEKLGTHFHNSIDRRSSTIRHHHVYEEQCVRLSYHLSRDDMTEKLRIWSINMFFVWNETMVQFIYLEHLDI